MSEHIGFRIDPTKAEEFMADLTELSRKYGIAVDACDCCQYISLLDCSRWPDGLYTHQVHSGRPMLFDSIQYKTADGYPVIDEWEDDGTDK